jgi:hypothetical protein
MAANIGTSITTLSDAGARSFIVANLPALGDKPNVINTPNQAFAKAFALVPEPSSLLLVSIAIAVPLLRKRR